MVESPHFGVYYQKTRALHEIDRNLVRICLRKIDVVASALNQTVILVGGQNTYLRSASGPLVDGAKREGAGVWKVSIL
jgi:hypothetical protein